MPQTPECVDAGGQCAPTDCDADGFISNGVADLVADGRGHINQNAGTRLNFAEGRRSTNKMAVYDLEQPEPCSAAEDFAPSGCTDPRATNHDAAAATNSGSCLYDCAVLAASGDGDASCILLVGGGSLDLPAPDLSGPASLIVQGRVYTKTVEVQAPPGSGAWQYVGCFVDSPARDMVLMPPLEGVEDGNQFRETAVQRLDLCAFQCRAEGYEVMGLALDNQCFCDSGLQGIDWGAQVT